LTDNISVIIQLFRNIERVGIEGLQKQFLNALSEIGFKCGFEHKFEIKGYYVDTFYKSTEYLKALPQIINAVSAYAPILIFVP
jgi:hypothetical protein